MAKLVAAMLRKKYRIKTVPTDKDLRRMLRGEKLKWNEELPFIGQLKEFYAFDELELRPGLARRWWRWVVAHGLIHHLCHVGNQLDPLTSPLVRNRQEREAELGAGYLFWSHLLEGDNLQPGLTYYEVAELAEVPVQCVVKWHGIYCTTLADAMNEIIG